MSYEIHPLAKLLKPLPADEFRALADDIEENGLIVPITLYQGKILDGVNRYRACQERSVIPKFRVERRNPVSFVLAANALRRHMTPSDLAIFIVEANEWLEPGRPITGSQEPIKETGSQEPINDGIKAKDMAALAGVSESTIKRAKKVVDKGSAALVKAVKDGAITVKQAAAVTDLPKSEQMDALAKPKATRKKRIPVSSDLQQRYDALKSEHDKLIKSYNELRDTYEDLADELKSVEEVRAKDETKALAKLRERIRFLERENGDMMNKNKAMLDQVKMWRRKCEKLEAK